MLRRLIRSAILSMSTDSDWSRPTVTISASKLLEQVQLALIPLRRITPILPV
jgi:hypothetical protein